MSAFEIDEKKFRSAIPPLRRTWEDDKRDLGMVARITAPLFLLAVSAGLLLLALLSLL